MWGFIAVFLTIPIVYPRVRCRLVLGAFFPNSVYILVMQFSGYATLCGHQNVSSSKKSLGLVSVRQFDDKSKSHLFREARHLVFTEVLSQNSIPFTVTSSSLMLISFTASCRHRLLFHMSGSVHSSHWKEAFEIMLENQKCLELSLSLRFGKASKSVWIFGHMTQESGGGRSGIASDWGLLGNTWTVKTCLH